MKLTDKELKLVEIAKAFISSNQERGLYLTGSLMLKLRGIDLGREVKDIDICEPEPDLTYWEVRVPDNFIFEDTIKNEDYRETLISKFYNEDADVMVDLINSFGDVQYDIINGIPCASVDSLIDAKRTYIKEGGYDNEKHERDIELIKNLYGSERILRQTVKRR